MVEIHLAACVGSEVDLHCFDMLEGDLHDRLEVGVRFEEIEVDLHFDKPEAYARLGEMEVDDLCEEREVDLHLDKVGVFYHFEIVEEGLAQFA